MAASVNEFNSRLLTSREKEVLQEVAQGLDVEAIAEQLSISRHTVLFHIKQASKKLNARNRTHAVAEAIRLGLINISSDKT